MDWYVNVFLHTNYGSLCILILLTFVKNDILLIYM